MGPNPETCGWCRTLQAADARRDQRRRYAPASAITADELNLLAGERQDRRDRLRDEAAHAERTQAAWDSQIEARLSEALAAEAAAA